MSWAGRAWLPAWAGAPRKESAGCLAVASGLGSRAASFGSVLPRCHVVSVGGDFYPCAFARQTMRPACVVAQCFVPGALTQDSARPVMVGRFLVGTKKALRREAWGLVSAGRYIHPPALSHFTRFVVSFKPGGDSGICAVSCRCSILRSRKGGGRGACRSAADRRGGSRWAAAGACRACGSRQA